MKKISLSMLLAFVVAAMFATVAFAAASDKPNATNAPVITHTAGGTQASATWTIPSVPKDAPAVNGQTVKLYNITDGGSTPIVVTKSTTYLDLTALLTAGKSYQLGVAALNTNGAGTEGLSATFTFAGAYSFTPENEVIRSTTPVDNNLQNANGTGTTDSTHTSYNKAASGQAVHGNYQNNTNSCASCHQTHTGATSKLLFKSSDYDVCIACHNGTMGVGMYNVFETNVSKDLGGGTFGGTHAGNMSVHLADGSVEIGAAPGSNSKVLGASWTSEFSCSSCHDPHGSYSTRLLKSNPNDMADVDRTVNTTAGYYYGQKINNLNITDATTATTWAQRKAKLPSSGSASAGTNYAALSITIQSADVDGTTTSDYIGTGLKPGDTVVQVYKFYENTSPTAWKPAVYEQAGGNSGDSIDLVTTTGDDFNGTNFDSTTNGTWKKAISNGKASVLYPYFVSGAKGFVRVQPADLAVLKQVTNLKTLQVVKWPQTPVAGLSFPNGKQVTKTQFIDLVGTNYANGYNEFCAACHVDYLTSKKYQTDAAGNATAGTGIDENYYHHAMSSSYTCARCHFAHGTDVTWMRDAAGRTIADLALPVNQGGENMDSTTATAYLMDQNPSSALKRYTNMAVCYGCHTSSHAEVIVNDGSYATSNQQVNGFLSDGYGKWFSDAVNNYTNTTKDATWGTLR